ncbi:conserved oligomeric Golgi complex subunit 8-like [Lineus longissimus]|uniref:conserved oligomeric Golgi complex subunit 8-like n=1 Tax=Lineus longissimus TaxID=88925 RepID=UPI002B4DFF58
MASLDVEDAGILSTIFKESFPESWRDNPDFAQYLAELSSYGVDKLAREPDRLAEERSQILEQTQDLAFHNYKTFIQTAECSREIFQDFQIIEKHVSELLDKLPEFSSECNGFLGKAQEINISRRMNSLTLQRHTQLLEILEMPQLMDTCVRNGYYEEALELAAHVKRLEKKHASIPVIQGIVNEVKGSTQLMLTQLVQQLRTTIQLPACLRVIGYLRRLDVFSEAELRIKFLQARDSWFQSILSGIPKDDAYYHITKTIEASRVHLFDIITQYRAIFSDDDPLMSARDDSTNEATLFHGWVVKKVSQFLDTLQMDLNKGVGGRLDSLIGQCMYFGLSFSRVGADFRGLLPPIFQRAAMDGLHSILVDANKRFEESMQSYSLLATSTVSSPYSYASQSLHLSPPMILLDFQPLAAYCNNILTAFNDLRLCAPISLAGRVALQVQKSLQEVVRIILAFHRAEESVFDHREKDAFGQFCHVFARELLPFINKCLQALFPPTAVAQALGVTVLDLAKLGKIGTVNINQVTSAMENLVPEKEEIPPEPVATRAISPVPSSLAKEADTPTSAMDSDSKPVTLNTDTASDDKLDSQKVNEPDLEPALSEAMVESVDDKPIESSTAESSVKQQETDIVKTEDTSVISKSDVPKSDDLVGAATEIVDHTGSGNHGSASETVDSTGSGDNESAVGPVLGGDLDIDLDLDLEITEMKLDDAMLELPSSKGMGSKGD